VILLFITKTELELLPFSTEKINMRISLSQCVVSATNSFLIDNYQTVYYSLPLVDTNDIVSLETYALPSLHALQNVTLLIKSFKSHTKGLKDKTIFKNFILHFRTRVHLHQQLDSLKKRKLFNPHAKFLLVSSTIFKDPADLALYVSKYMFYENVVHSVIMTVDPRELTTFHVYSWGPYKSGQCGDNFQVAAKAVDSCSFGKYKYEINWFEHRIPKTFNKCPVRVKYAHAPPLIYQEENQLKGLEIELLSVIAHQLSLTMVYEETSVDEIGHVNSDGEVMGAFKNLENKTADIIIGGYPKEYLWSILFDASHSYTQDAVIWCAPSVPLLDDFQNLFKLMEIRCIFLMALAHLLLSLSIWWSSLNYSEEHHIYKNFVNTFVHSFAFFLGSAMPVAARTHKVRYFLLLFIFFGFFSVVTLNTHLISFSSRTYFQPKYSKVEDIYDNNLKAYSFAQEKLFANLIDDKTFVKMKPRIKTCVDLKMCLKYVSVDQDSALCTTNFYKNYIIKNGTIKNIYCLNKERLPFSVNFIMRKGFPLYE
ncbi:Ionotropic receptor 102, partial|nr:Ionotropic receptor 102 [Diabrotica virgifera virgifera]